MSSDMSLCMPNASTSLSPFQRWCETEYRPGYHWDEVFGMLRKDDVGIDLFPIKKKMKPAKLISLCPSSNLKEATVEHLCKAHTRWARKRAKASKST